MNCNPGPDEKDDVNRLDEPSLNALPQNGIYTILIHIQLDVNLKIGSLGILKIRKGFYAYTGSGQGRGALSLRGRVSRHISKRKKLKWHIDYLLSSNHVKVIGVVASQAGKEYECKVASAINGVSSCIRSFGCSDCKCTSHLALLPCGDENSCLKMIEQIYRQLGLNPVVLKL